jgi:hypothetical protein
VDEQQEQINQYMGSMEEEVRNIKHAFKKSTIPNFPSYDTDVAPTTDNSSLQMDIHKPNHMVCW